jgi:hypothetical protein
MKLSYTVLMKHTCIDALIDACSGEDGQAMEAALRGAVGVISVTANVKPKAMHLMMQAALKKDVSSRPYTTCVYIYIYILFCGSMYYLLNLMCTCFVSVIRLIRSLLSFLMCFLVWSLQATEAKRLNSMLEPLHKVGS